MDIIEALTAAVEREASDIFLVAGMPLSYKIGGRIEEFNEAKMSPSQIEEMVAQLYQTAGFY